MPGKRPVKKGSFGSHFDELVKNFPHDEPKPKKREHHRKDRKSGGGNIHD